MRIEISDQFEFPQGAMPVELGRINQTPITLTRNGAKLQVDSDFASVLVQGQTPEAAA